ncbi:checkpoint protein Hus1/Mec3 [Polychytrium aggregatum]|uniref:checkpoint protein Hus1/Mec3 n=1 Tax=Polychytrium aggregatum TaxID=110093 RepID=UPI0022FEBF64|nr:checkpoint protein Hus1/Mec3 [Polychytrium aggregatum]KAI9207229.1 checkpoint protein Hus1/Mec3 [Polychytrium aggregatum]
MRMKTKITNPAQFARMAMTLEKIAKTWILRLTPSDVYFIVSQADVDSGIQVWGSISTSFIFADYRIESANENQIFLQLSGEHLVRSLKSAQNATEITMKLAKKNSLPVLSFQIANQSRTGNCVLLVQDIPVRVLTPPEAEELKEPLVPEPHVHIMMPPLSSIRTIAERMKSMSNYITISANMRGEFVLKIDTDSVEVETSYRNLINPEFDPSQVDSSQQPSANRDPTLFADARVDARDFVKFVQSYVVNPTNVVCCIIENRGLVFYVYVGGPNESQCGNLTYYIPVRSL